MRIPTTDLRAVEKRMSQREIDVLEERQKRRQRLQRISEARTQERERHKQRIHTWKEHCIEIKCSALLNGEPIPYEELPMAPSHRLYIR